jgi:hypothetical protein
MGSHQKAEKVLHDLAIWLLVRFLLHWYHICIFWLLRAVKSDSMSVPKILFWCIVYRFENDHLPRRINNYISYRDWPENPIMTLFPTDCVLLEVRNRRERCHAWSPIATTSHVWTLSMLFLQDSTSTSTTLFVPSFGYTTWPCLVCLQLRSDTHLASCYRPAITRSHPLCWLF